jgi:hypothetical protein
MLPSKAGRKNGPLLGAIFLSAAAHLAALLFWPVVASGSPSLRKTVVLNVSLPDLARLPPSKAGRNEVAVKPRSESTEEKALDAPGRALTGDGAVAPAADSTPVRKGEALAWDVRYFSPRLLDRVPVAEQYAIPTAPDGENALAGEVRLEVFVEADGSVTHVNVISLGDLPPEYGAAARAVFYQTRFSPGMRAGVAVPVRLKVVVKYGVAGP